MAEKDRVELKSDNDALFPDNTTQDITPARKRQFDQDMVDSNLNIATTADQDVQGIVDFVLGAKVAGERLVPLCDTYSISSEQDWIDHSVEISATRRQIISGATYLICGTVERSFEIETNGFNTILGDNPNIDVDKYTGGGTSWNDAAALSGLTIVRCSVVGVLGSGSKFLSQTNGAFIISVEVGFVSFDDLGTSDAVIVLFDKLAFGASAFPVLSGINITSTNTPSISITSCSMHLDPASAVTGIDITTATSISSITLDVVFGGGTFAGSIGIKGAPNSANLLGTARGVIRNCNFRTIDIPLSGITVDDLKWTLQDNQGIQNTLPDGHATCMDRTTFTSTLNGVPIEVGGGTGVNAWLDVGSSQFTVDTLTGRITYIGLDPIRAPVDFGCTLDPQSGTNKNMYIYIGFGAFGDANPTALPESRSETRVDNGDPKPLSTFTQITFETGDYISPMVELKSGEANTDILCTNNKLRVN